MKDSEETYLDWNLDVYQDQRGVWWCDYWPRSFDTPSASVSGPKRKEVVAAAKKMIDLTEYIKAEMGRPK